MSAIFPASALVFSITKVAEVDRSRIISACVALSLVLSACDASADMEIPMLALAWPAFWIALVPVILTEAFICVRELGLGWTRALKVSTAANLMSTFVGIPVAWIMLVGIEILVGISANALAMGHAWDYALFPLMLAWLNPTKNVWIIYAAFALLAIPFCVVSIWIERLVAIRMLPELQRDKVHAWVKRANIWSYVLLVACSIAYPLLLSK